MLLKEIVGHQSLIHSWKQALAEDRLHPVQLFQTQEGSGVLQLVMALAQYLLCEKTSPAVANAQPLFPLTDEEKSNAPHIIQDSCGVCGSCQRIQTFSHPDLHFFYPVINQPKSTAGKEKKISQDYLSEWVSFLQHTPYGNLYDWVKVMDGESNKQPNINVEECRHFLEVMGKKPYEGDRKVIIFWLPEYLGNEANRLLKTLEEPPDDTFLLFVTQDSKALLSTVVSRCLSIVLPQPSDEDIKTYLLQRYPDLSPERVAMLLSFCQGNLRLLHQYLEVGFEAEQSLYEDILFLLDGVLVGGPVQQMEWIQRMNEKPRVYIDQFFKFLRSHLYIYACQAMNIRSQALANDEHQRLMTVFSQIGVENYADLCIELIDQTVYALSRNAHLKMQLHDFIIQIHRLIQQQKFYFPSYKEH